MPLIASCYSRPGCVVAAGKSAFGVFAMRTALLQRPARHVVYLSDKTRNAWLFRAKASGDSHDVVPFNKTEPHLLSELDDRRTVYISDSLRPQTVAAFTIMITSPRRSSYHEFYKSQPCEQLVFPPFSWAEIQAMHGTCFPHIAEADVRAGYSLGGGIPRNIFALSSKTLGREIQLAMTSVDLDEMIDEMDSPIIETDSKQNHRLLHMLPYGVVGGAAAAPPPMSLEFYVPTRLVLASTEVAHRIYVKAVETANRRLRKLLAESPSPPTRAALYQSMYENAVLAELEKGCILTCWDSKSDTSSMLTVPRCKRAYFDSIATLSSMNAASSQHLLVPRSKSFAAVDAILPGGHLAQVTISPSHDVKLLGGGNRLKEGLMPVDAAFRPHAGIDDDINLYWILPEALFDELVRSKKLPVSFPLIMLPDEKAAAPELAALAKLQDNLQTSTASRIAATALGSDVLVQAAETAFETAKANLLQKQTELAPRQAQWAALKKRVRHHAVCMQFNTEGQLKQRAFKRRASQQQSLPPHD